MADYLGTSGYKEQNQLKSFRARKDPYHKDTIHELGHILQIFSIFIFMSKMEIPLLHWSTLRVKENASKS